MINIANDLVGQFGRLIGIANLSLDEQFYCLLSFDKSYNIHLRYVEESNKFLFYTKLGNVNVASRLQVYTKLLNANHLWSETNGATLSIQESDHSVYLAYAETLQNMGFPEFEACMDNFLQTSIKLSNLIEEITEETLRSKETRTSSENHLDLLNCI